jgi:hypothetical protein
LGGLEEALAGASLADAPPPPAPAPAAASAAAASDEEEGMASAALATTTTTTTSSPIDLTAGDPDGTAAALVAAGFAWVPNPALPGVTLQEGHLGASLDALLASAAAASTADGTSQEPAC